MYRIRRTAYINCDANIEDALLKDAYDEPFVLQLGGNKTPIELFSSGVEALPVAISIAVKELTARSTQRIEHL